MTAKLIEKPGQIVCKDLRSNSRFSSILVFFLAVVKKGIKFGF